MLNATASIVFITCANWALIGFTKDLVHILQLCLSSTTLIRQVRHDALPAQPCQQALLHAHARLDLARRHALVEQLQRVGQRAHVDVAPRRAAQPDLLEALRVRVRARLHLPPRRERRQRHVGLRGRKDGPRGGRGDAAGGARRRRVGRLGVDDAHLLQAVGEAGGRKVGVGGVVDGGWRVSIFG